MTDTRALPLYLIEDFLPDGIDPWDLATAAEEAIDDTGRWQVSETLVARRTVASGVTPRLQITIAEQPHPVFGTAWAFTAARVTAAGTEEHYNHGFVGELTAADAVENTRMLGRYFADPATYEARAAAEGWTWTQDPSREPKNPDQLAQLLAASMANGAYESIGWWSRQMVAVAREEANFQLLMEATSGLAIGGAYREALTALTEVRQEVGHPEPEAILTVRIAGTQLWERLGYRLVGIVIRMGHEAVAGDADRPQHPLTRLLAAGFPADVASRFSDRDRFLGFAFGRWLMDVVAFGASLSRIAEFADKPDGPEIQWFRGFLRQSGRLVGQALGTDTTTALARVIDRGDREEIARLATALLYDAALTADRA